MSVGVKYLHEDVHLVCTNGFKPSQLTVANRKVRLANGKLIATKNDKPTNFMCKWAGIVVAFMAAAFIALFTPIGPIVALLLSFLAGIAASAIIGSGLCYFLLKNAHWQNIHPKVKVMGVNALTEKSQLKCPIGGQIYVFFSPVIANKQAAAFAFKNAGQIVAAASMGRGAGNLIGIGKTYGVFSAQMGGAVALAVGCVVVINPLLLMGQRAASDATSDGILHLAGDPYDGQSSPMEQDKKAEWLSQNGPLWSVGKVVSPYKNHVLSPRDALDKHRQGTSLAERQQGWQQYFPKEQYLRETKGMSLQERLDVWKQYSAQAKQQAVSANERSVANAASRSKIGRSVSGVLAPIVGSYIFDTAFQVFQKNVNDHYVAEEEKAKAGVHVFATTV